MKKEYPTLQKKYDLPKLEDMDKYFQISSIEAKHFLIKEIAEKMNEKVTAFAMVMEEILSPEAKFSTLHESNTFTTDDKKEVLKIYRKLMLNKRNNLMLELKYDEKEIAEHIRKLFSDWEEIYPTLRKIISKMKESWSRDKKTKLELSYFG
ncbi:MAG: hypothetical protein ABH828_03330 [archaeon]